MKKFLAIAILMSFASVTLAQVPGPVKAGPKVVITAPSKVAIGEMIVVDVSKSTGSGFTFIVQPTPARIFEDSSGKTITFGTGTDIKEFLLIVSCAKGDESDCKTQKIKVRGVGGLTSQPLGEIIKELAVDVQSPDVRGDALKLSQSFSTMALDQDVKDVPALLKKTGTSNRDALNGHFEAWSEVRRNITAYLKELAKEGKLKGTDLETHRTIWKGIAKALAEFAEKD